MAFDRNPYDRPRNFQELAVFLSPAKPYPQTSLSVLERLLPHVEKLPRSLREKNRQFLRDLHKTGKLLEFPESEERLDYVAGGLK